MQELPKLPGQSDETSVEDIVSGEIQEVPAQQKSEKILDREAVEKEIEKALAKGVALEKKESVESQREESRGVSDVNLPQLKEKAITDEPKLEKSALVQDKKTAPGVLNKLTPEFASDKNVKEESVKDGVGLEKKRRVFTDTLVRPLRTYKEDVAEAMQKRKTSITSVLAAEQERRAENRPESKSAQPHSRKAALLATSSVLLVVLGVGALVGVFFFTKDGDQKETRQKPLALVFADDEIEVPVGTLSPSALKNRLTAEKESVSLSLGEVAELYLTEINEGVIHFLTAQEFFRGIAAAAPASFLRGIDDRFMLGIHAFDGNQAFLLLRVHSFENVFSGLLFWEELMAENLAPLFGPAVAPVRESTSTPAVAVSFVDKVIRNHDVRVLLRPDGKTALLYVFPSRGTLIITTNEHTMAEVLTRMTNVRTIR